MSGPKKELVKAAGGGDAKAQHLLAQQLRTADPPDYQGALEWYRRSAEQGYAPAQNDLGTMYLNGVGVAEDPVKAASLYRLAAEQGQALAQYNLAVLHLEGSGVTADLREAVRWLKLSADGGESQAMARLGVAFRFGRGVPRDTLKAAALLSRAAASDDITAMGNLADMVEELEALAKTGDLRAAFSLAVIHRGAYGVPRDRPTALAWLMLSTLGVRDQDEKSQIEEELFYLAREFPETEVLDAKTKMRELQASLGLASAEASDALPDWAEAALSQGLLGRGYQEEASDDPPSQDKFEAMMERGDDSSLIKDAEERKRYEEFLKEAARPAEFERFCKEFWSEFLRDLRLDDRTQGVPDTTSRPLIDFSLPPSGRSRLSVYFWDFLTTRSVNIVLSVGSGADLAYERLSQQRVEIESEIGIPITWSSDGGRHSISVRKTFPDLRAPEHRSEMKAYLSDVVNRFVNVFRPRLARIAEQL